jgi:hypothetical protein
MKVHCAIREFLLYLLGFVSFLYKKNQVLSLSIKRRLTDAITSFKSSFFPLYKQHNYYFCFYFPFFYFHHFYLDTFYIQSNGSSWQKSRLKFSIRFTRGFTIFFCNRYLSYSTSFKWKFRSDLFF